MLNRLSAPPAGAEGEYESVGGSRALDLEQLLAAARRQARVVGFAAAVGGLLGLAYAISATPLYTATTDLLIDSQKDKTELSASIAELTFDTGAIDSQVEVLKSEKIALAVIAALSLTHDPEFMGARGTPIGQALAALRSTLDFVGWFVSRERSVAEADENLQRAAIDQLRAGLEVRRIAHTYVLAIDYTSPDRVKSATIANAFGEAYLNDQLDGKFEATRRAAGWLQSRIAELKQQSIDSDLAVQKFKADKGIVVTGGDRPGLMSDQQLTQINEQMVLARADTGRAEARYQQIEDLINSGRVGASVPDSLANPVITDLREKYLAASKMEAQLEGKLGPQHLQVINLKNEMQEFERLISEELRRIAESYRSDAEVARDKEQSLALELSGLVGENAGTNQTLVQLRELEREADTYRNLYQVFMQRYQEALQQQSFPVTEARVITAATPPRAPSAPRRGTIVALSLLLGAMVGGGLGALREYRDRVFRVAADVREGLGLDFLGLLQAVKATVTDKAEAESPVVPGETQTADALLRYSIDHPLSQFTETLRSAKVAIDLSLAAQRSKVIGVVSALPNEGKSTLAKNLASLLAHLGASCLLIDGDLRNPGLTLAIARHAEVGLLEVVRGERSLGETTMLEGDSGLKFLPTVIVKRQQHPSEVLASPGMRALFGEAGRSFEYVIVDLPPLGPVVDVRAAAQQFDAFLLIVEWGRTPRALAQELLSDAALANKCVGVIYNKVDIDRVNLYESYGSTDYYYYGYGAYYHRERA
jgi:succinoglycan biosynthesis transport protein ExoP